MLTTRICWFWEEVYNNEAIFRKRNLLDNDLRKENQLSPDIDSRWKNDAESGRTHNLKYGKPK